MSQTLSLSSRENWIISTSILLWASDRRYLSANFDPTVLSEPRRGKAFQR
jgi:hypothetical protein